MDELELLRASLADSLIVSKGEYQYFVHPLSDGVPLVEAAADTFAGVVVQVGEHLCYAIRHFAEREAVVL